MNILVIEDDDNLRRGLQELLSLEGYTVSTAADGQSAIRQWEQQPPDFYLLDIMLPDTSGYTLCRKIRARTMTAPILMLSARGEEIDRILGFESGADDYVTKPFSARELVMRIKAIARRVQMQPKTPVTPHAAFLMGDLHIDPQALCACRQDTIIDLSPRELQLLVLLYQRTGKVVSRNELYDHGWGRDFMPNSRALDQYISTLRQKIERNPASPQIIQTVRGAGYRYPAPAP